MRFMDRIDETNCRLIASRLGNKATDLSGSLACLADLRYMERRAMNLSL